MLPNSLSADGKSWWDGTAWHQVSDNGKWWWDGVNWKEIPTTAVVAGISSIAGKRSRREARRERALAKLVSGRGVPLSMRALVADELSAAQAYPAEWAGMQPAERKAWLESKRPELKSIAEAQRAVKAQRPTVAMASMPSARQRLATHFADPPDGPIVEQPARLTRSLLAMLGTDETIHVMVKGTWKEGLICTNSRVIILKGGFMTNQIFGTSTYQLPYANIAGAEVKEHLMSGYFQLNAGGMDRTPKTYWESGHNRRTTNPAQAPNSVSLTRNEEVACRLTPRRTAGGPLP